MYLKSILHYLYNSVFFSKIFHTLRNDLLVELRGCKTVLDLGCGPSSPLQFCDHIEYSIGVEGFEPYLERSEKLSIQKWFRFGMVISCIVLLGAFLRLFHLQLRQKLLI